MTLDGAKQYRDELSIELASAVTDYKAKIGSIDTKVDTAIGTIAPALEEVTNKNGELDSKVEEASAWAEGEDVDVVALGGSKSSKGWASDSRSIQTKVELLESKVTSAIASIGKAVVHISGTTFQKVGSAFVFHDTHVSQVANTLPVFTLGIADRSIFFLLNNTNEPPYPSIFGANDRIQFQLPSVLDVSRVLKDPSEPLSNDNPYIYKDFSFTIRILGGTGAKGLAVHSGVVNATVNGADTQVEDFIDDEDGSATTSGTKVTKNYDGQSALLTFHAKYDINKINQSQNWVVEHTVVGAGASTGLLKKADADGYYLARRYLSQILLSTNKLNNMGRGSGSVKTAIDLKADASALDAKADKANTRKWLIIDSANARGLSISDVSQPDYLYYITGGDILDSGTQARGDILYYGTQIGGQILDSGSQDGGRILQRGNQFGGQILYYGTQARGDILYYGTQTSGDILRSGTQAGGDILYGGTQAGGDILANATQIGGDILHRGTQSGGDILPNGTQNGGNILDNGTQIGGTILHRGTQTGGHILLYGKAIGTRLGMKVYGGNWSRATLNNCIFTADFSCPATIPADLSSVTGYDASAGSDENGTVAERINWLQGRANQSQWTGIKIFGGFYEDGAILSGIPADVRAKIRPIAEMGLPPVSAPSKEKYQRKRLSVSFNNTQENTWERISAFDFYNLKANTRYKLRTSYTSMGGNNYAKIAWGTDINRGQNFYVHIIKNIGQGVPESYFDFITSGSSVNLYCWYYGPISSSSYSSIYYASNLRNEQFVELLEVGPTEETTEFDAP